MKVVVGEDSLAELMLHAARGRRVLDDDADGVCPRFDHWDCLESLVSWAENLVTNLEVAA